MRRRNFVLSGLACLVAPAVARAQHNHFESLRQPGRIDLPAEAEVQRFFDSPAPRAANQGRWVTRAPLPLPRSEMAWGTSWNGRMHVVGGYGEQRVDRPYHHIYDPATDLWIDAPPMPRGGNHVGVVADAGVVYAIGGFVEQNRTPYDECFAFDVATNAWRRIAPLDRARGAAAIVALDGLIHSIGGAMGSADRRSIDWHDVYDPKADRWTSRAPLPQARDHTGTVVVNGRIHVIGGRFDNFANNTALHHLYDPRTDRWSQRAPLPTARSGQGAAWYRNRIFVAGGEGTGRVFGQNEAYDPMTDRWEAYAPMTTPRHGLSVAVVGDAVHIAGGGPIVGGGVQSAVHEAFMLA
ncbi:MAG: kelch repeat-containing protein [Rhodospirillales bacterium]|nr:kelch repeat-containing protein [Rhodospirillales bacterium]